MNTDGSSRPARRRAGGGWDGKLRIDRRMWGRRLKQMLVARQGARREALMERGRDAAENQACKALHRLGAYRLGDSGARRGWRGRWHDPLRTRLQCDGGSA